MVLLHSDSFGSNKGMDIHIRTKHRRQFSYVSSAVVRIGEDILEVAGKEKGFYINGQHNVPLPATIAGYAVNHKIVDDHQQLYTVDLDDDQQIVIKTWMEFVSIKILHAQEKDFGDSVGLMGSFSTGKLVARDGQVLNDWDAFGRDWQVRSDEPMFFQFLQMPQHPQECAAPPVLDYKVRGRRLDETLSEDEAALACAHVSADDKDFCIYDVMATNDVNMAGAY